jgi:CheY-like chemotaxis protein
MGEKVLVVDDDPDIVKFIEVTLTRAGFDVGVAYDGREALDRVSEWRPDLVLLDIMLPSIDGFEVAHDLRRRARLTGMASSSSRPAGCPRSPARALDRRRRSSSSRSSRTSSSRASGPPGGSTRCAALPLTGLRDGPHRGESVARWSAATPSRSCTWTWTTSRR